MLRGKFKTQCAINAKAAWQDGHLDTKRPGGFAVFPRLIVSRSHRETHFAHIPSKSEVLLVLSNDYQRPGRDTIPHLPEAVAWLAHPYS